MSKILKAIAILFLSGFSIRPAISQPPNYKELFRADWEKAGRFISENQNWIRSLMKKHDIPYNAALSVVFPELVRYSALQDKIEITLLKALYINLGEEYANFSIGPFQIKPVFAERIREEFPEVSELRADGFLKKKDTFDDIKSYRASIVEDLEKPETEIIYLVAFIKICQRRFNINDLENSESIHFLASAYNCGFWRTKEQIDSIGRRKFFSTSLVSSVKYSYSDISVFWFQQQPGDEINN